MSSSLNSSKNASTSNDGTGRAFTSSFSGQSGAASPAFNHDGFTHGLHNIHGNINVPMNWGTLGSINSGLSDVPSAGVQQQDGIISNAIFASTDLPVELSKMSLDSSHGHSRLTTRGGLGVSPMGNAGSRITSSMGIGNMVGGGSMGSALSNGGGLSTPSLGSQLNLAVNNGSVNIEHNQMMSGVLPQGSPQVLATLPGYKGSNADYQMDLHHNQQLLENSILMMQSQLAMGRSSGFSLGGEASTSHHPQHQQNAQAVSSSGVSLQMERSGGFSLGGAYTSHHPQQQHNTQAVSSSGVSLHGSDIFPSSYPSYHSQSQAGGIGIRSMNSANSVTGMGYDQPLQQYQNTVTQNTVTGMSYNQPLQQYQHHQNTSQYHMPQMSAVSQPFREVGLNSMQGTNSNPNRFGLLALLPVIKMSDPDLTTLALGMDLTKLGLDLTSTEDLYKTFASPWSNGPAKADPEFSVPQSYNTRNPPPLHEALFRKLPLETLFYAFYSMPRDEAQLYAANELDNRGWFYHKELKLWFIRIGEPLMKTDKGERGTYECFDPNSFTIIQKENYVIYYEMLEKIPSLPQHRA